MGIEQQELSKTKLLDQIDKQARKVHTRSLDISFSQILTMYNSKDLIIRPDYQRAFRWSVIQQSRFVESLILEIPIPPIYFAEMEDANMFELVDGLQRVSSVLNLFGLLPKEMIEATKRYEKAVEQEDDNDESVEDNYELQIPYTDAQQPDEDSLRLDGCEIIKALNGKVFKELPLATQRHLRYSSIRVEIIRKESPQDIKYFLFKRLNRGGSQLSDQEVRNSIVRMGNEKIINFIGQLAEDENFRCCVERLSQRQIETKYDEELVLRFFAFKNYREVYEHDINAFLDKYIEGVAGLGEPQLPFDYEAEENNFKKTFHVLNKALGSATFSATIQKSGKIYFTGFRSLLFEAITLGIQQLLPDLNPENRDQMSNLNKAVNQIKKNPAFKNMITGGGRNYPKKLEERINFVKDELFRYNILNSDS